MSCGRNEETTMWSRNSLYITISAAIALATPAAVLASDSLAGTKWGIVMGKENPDIWHHRFNSDHTWTTTVRSCPAPHECYTTEDNGTWSQDGNSVSWQTSERWHYTGTIDGNQMAGKAQRYEETYTWTAKRE